jgi:hypothetical protein
VTKPPKRPRDPNQLAKLMVDIATCSEPSRLQPLASDERKRASAKGGFARSENLTTERKSEIASNAAEKRWKAKE